MTKAFSPHRGSHAAPLLLLLGSTLLPVTGLIQVGAQTAETTKSVEAMVPHTFVFETATNPKTVTVAGTFNNWNNGANPLVPDATGKIWKLTLPLPYGKHQYKFVVNGDNWVTDPKAAKNEDDGNGNVNSILFLTPPDYLRPASPQDGLTARSALLHLTSVPHLNYDRGQLTLALRTRPRDLKQVRLKVGNKRYNMALLEVDDLYARYRIQLPWDRKNDLTYAFELVDGNQVREFGTNGLGAAASVQPFRLKAKEFKPFVVPEWVERTVFYQIFPDRFANGDKRNDPADVQTWNANPTYFNRYGGDAQGVRQHLSHLVDLRVSGVYFNPIFQAPSNHRYDAEDFKRIDAQFGTNAEFATLSRELQARGIRTVLDFVFNHTATTFPPFLDIRQKGEASAYKNWYFIKSYPVQVQENPNYVAWYNYPSMPKLNLANPETRDYMLNLVNFWHQQIPLSGLRLDVANEVEPAFWRDLRKRVKTLDPKMWIVGEVWGDGSPWLTGDQWDSVMNYQFRDANLRYFAEGKTTPTQFTNRLMQLHHSYVPQVSRNMMNLLSSHDTPRFLTLCGNNASLHRLAATVQFTWVGAPSIYYGEELGMQGGADPDNRRGMAWEMAKPENPMLRHYKRLIQLRNASRALQSGDPKVLLTDDRTNVLAYERTVGNETALVALNRSNSPQTVHVPLPATAAMNAARKSGLVDGLSGRRYSPGTARTLRMTLAPLQAAVLLPATPILLRSTK